MLEDWRKHGAVCDKCFDVSGCYTIHSAAVHSSVCYTYFQGDFHIAVPAEQSFSLKTVHYWVSGICTSFARQFLLECVQQILILKKKTWSINSISSSVLLRGYTHRCTVLFLAEGTKLSNFAEKKDYRVLDLLEISRRNQGCKQDSVVWLLNCAGRVNVTVVGPVWPDVSGWNMLFWHRHEVNIQDKLQHTSNRTSSDE